MWVLGRWGAGALGRWGAGALGKTMSSLFTFILEFRGGTYVSQYRGRSPRQALRTWGKQEHERLIGQWRPQVTDALFAGMASETLVAMDGAIETYVTSTPVIDDLAWLYVIRTQEI